MNNETNKKHPVHALLDDIFATTDVHEVIAEYQRQNSGQSKWLMYSDYCLDDKSKANDVMTFVLMPFESEAKYQEMQETIHKLQPKDIKKVKADDTVNSAFLSYLKSKNVLTFSFVLNDRKNFLGSSYEKRLNGVKQSLLLIRDCYEGWKKTAVDEDVLKHYDSVVKRINQQLASLNGKSPDIKLLNDILMTAFLGAYVSAKVLENLPIEIFGWFSDRDKVISGRDHIIVPIFTYFQHNMLGGRQFQFCTFVPDDSVKPFFDDFNRIADVITGAIADYNMEQDYITAEKFNSVLIDFLADNKQALIFRIRNSDTYSMSRIMMHPK